MFGRYRLDAALALVEPAAAEFADLGDDPGLATLLGQLARFQMLRQVDFGAAIANADRTLAIAERLDRVDLVADTLVTRGVALVSVGRAYEGIGCLETGLRLAQQHGLLATEIRARTNMGGPLTDRDPRAAFEVSRVGLEQARRFGHRQGVSMLIGNASVGAIETGRLGLGPGRDRARASRRPPARRSGSSSWASSPSCGSREARTRARSSTRPTPGSPAHVADEPYLESSIAMNGAARAACSAATWRRRRPHFLDAGRLDPYNAVASSCEAVLFALLARDVTAGPGVRRRAPGEPDRTPRSPS